MGPTRPSVIIHPMPSENESNFCREDAHQRYLYQSEGQIYTLSPRDNQVLSQSHPDDMVQNQGLPNNSPHLYLAAPLIAHSDISVDKAAPTSSPMIIALAEEPNSLMQTPENSCNGHIQLSRSHLSTSAPEKEGPIEPNIRFHPPSVSQSQGQLATNSPSGLSSIPLGPVAGPSANYIQEYSSLQQNYQLQLHSPRYVSAQDLPAHLLSQSFQYELPQRIPEARQPATQQHAQNFDQINQFCHTSMPSAHTSCIPIDRGTHLPYNSNNQANESHCDTINEVNQYINKFPYSTINPNTQFQCYTNHQINQNHHSASDRKIQHQYNTNDQVYLIHYGTTDHINRAQQRMNYPQNPPNYANTQLQYSQLSLLQPPQNNMPIQQNQLNHQIAMPTYNPAFPHLNNNLMMMHQNTENIAVMYQTYFELARKRFSRTRTGCLTCRKRRIKCDERKPACLNCELGNKVCLGYKKFEYKEQRKKPAKSSEVKNEMYAVGLAETVSSGQTIEAGKHSSIHNLMN